MALEPIILSAPPANNAVADAVGILAKLHVAGAVEFVLKAPVPADANGYFSDWTRGQAGQLAASWLRGSGWTNAGLVHDDEARRPAHSPCQLSLTSA